MFSLCCHFKWWCHYVQFNCREKGKMGLRVYFRGEQETKWITILEMCNVVGGCSSLSDWYVFQVLFFLAFFFFHTICSLFHNHFTIQCLFSKKIFMQIIIGRFFFISTAKLCIIFSHKIKCVFYSRLIDFIWIYAIVFKHWNLQNICYVGSNCRSEWNANEKIYIISF